MKTIKQIRNEAKHLFRLCLVDGSLNEGRAQEVARRVAESRRRGGLVLLQQFLRLVKLDRARHSATIESATALPADLQTSVRSGLERAYGDGISITFAESPSLIGGMRIKVGSDVYDGSVRARLAALEEGFAL